MNISENHYLSSYCYMVNVDVYLFNFGPRKQELGLKYCDNCLTSNEVIDKKQRMVYL